MAKEVSVTDTSVANLSSFRSSDISLLRPTSTIQENPFTFEGGDITITVNVSGQEIKGKVISGSMASASPVWKKFIFLPWVTGGVPVQDLDFREDDSEALLTLLRIVHFQFAKVPTSFKASIKPLYQIAILCEQYDCISIVKPWAEGWCMRLDNHHLALLAGDTKRKAYIAWAFGLADKFKGLAKKLVEECTVQENGTLEDDEVILPDKLLESIQNIRKQTLMKLLDIPYSHIRRRAMVGCPYTNERCSALVYGSLLLALEKCKLWPKTTAEEVKDSVTTIADLIGDLKVLYLDDDPNDVILPESKKHHRCRVQYRPKVQMILDTIPDPTLDCHIRHMQLRSGSATIEELNAAPATLKASISSPEPPQKKRMMVILPSSGASKTPRHSFDRRYGERTTQSLTGSGNTSPGDLSKVEPPRGVCPVRQALNLWPRECSDILYRGQKRPLSDA